MYVAHHWNIHDDQSPHPSGLRRSFSKRVLLCRWCGVRVVCSRANIVSPRFFGLRRSRARGTEAYRGKKKAVVYDGRRHREVKPLLNDPIPFLWFHPGKCPRPQQIGGRGLFFVELMPPRLCGLRWTVALHLFGFVAAFLYGCCWVVVVSCSRAEIESPRFFGCVAPFYSGTRASVGVSSPFDTCNMPSGARM